jgi:hypothetical protein
MIQRAPFQCQNIAARRSPGGSFSSSIPEREPARARGGRTCSRLLRFLFHLLRAPVRHLLCWTRSGAARMSQSIDLKEETLVPAKRKHSLGDAKNDLAC